MHQKACSFVMCVSVFSCFIRKPAPRYCVYPLFHQFQISQRSEGVCLGAARPGNYVHIAPLVSTIHCTKYYLPYLVLFTELKILFTIPYHYSEKHESLQHRTLPHVLSCTAINFTFHCTPSACVPCVYPIVNQQLNHINIPWHQNWLRSVLCTIVRNTVQWTILHYRADAPLHQTWLWSVLQYEILFWNTGQMHQTWLRCRFLGSGRRDGWVDALSTDSSHRRHYFESY